MLFIVALALVAWRAPSVAADAQAPRISLTSDLDSLHLRTQQQATILITFTTTDGTPVSGAHWTTACLAGTLGPVQELGAGRYRAVYQAPAARYPQVDLVVVRDGSGRIGWLALPLFGYGELVAETEPRARVTLEVAGARFGPARADADGIVRIPFEAPPGVAAGTIATTAEAAQGTSRPVDLGVPEVARLLVLPPAAGLIADGRSTAEIELFGLGPDLAPARGNPIRANVLAGEIVSIDPVGPGRYTATYQAPFSLPAGPTEVTFWFDDDPERSRQVVRIDLLPPPPTQVRLTIEPAKLPADGSARALVRAQALGPAGQPAAGATVDLTSKAGSLEDQHGDGPGAIRAWLIAPSARPASGRLAITATAAVPGTPAVVATQIVTIEAPAALSPAPKPPPAQQPGIRPATWGWIALGAGLASLAPGAALLGIDGQETCDAPAAVRCPEVYDTLVPGAVLTGLGAALLVTGVVLHVLDDGPGEPEAAEAGVGFAPLPGGGQVVGRWSF